MSSFLLRSPASAWPPCEGSYKRQQETEMSSLVCMKVRDEQKMRDTRA